MALPDWTVATTNANALARIFHGAPRYGPFGAPPVPVDVPVIAAPLVGTGSLLMHLLQSNLRVQIWRRQSVEHGFALGRLRTLALVPTFGGGVLAWGLYCLADQERLLDGVGHAILLSLHTLSLANIVELGPVSTGLADPVSIPGVQTGDHQWALDTVCALELAWQSDGTACTVTYRQGSQPDFSDLATVLTYTGPDPSAGQPRGEGVWAATLTANGGKVCYDETTVTPPWAL